jgi:hypothetical protein
MHHASICSHLVVKPASNVSHFNANIKLQSVGKRNISENIKIPNNYTPAELAFDRLTQTTSSGVRIPAHLEHWFTDPYGAKNHRDKIHDRLILAKLLE